jgi:argininosuccinate lyase
MSRLWNKGAPLDDGVQRFTVGDDPQLDRQLIHWDCLGSAAHVLTLERAGLLTTAERQALLGGLSEIDALDQGGRFEIPQELEDGHTAIENHLTATVGPVGQKIHTGRSRNDQVATAMRLFMRHHALRWVDRLSLLVGVLLSRIQRDGDTAMPGYTHLQPAMPSSVGQWLHAFAEAALEHMRACIDLFDRLDVCPLGSGAGFGVPLPLDLQYAAERLGFARVQRSPIDVQNSRGRMETYFVRAAADAAGTLEKLSWDLILFSSAEFGFFTLPESMTTGSSIMPQKRNPDVLELLRARAGRMRARLAELEGVAAKLPSSYHRDLQLTKEPTLRTAAELPDMLQIGAHVAAQFKLNEQRLAGAMRPELYATQAAYDLVRQGVPFREAYRRIADEVRAGRFAAPQGDPAARPAAHAPSHGPDPSRVTSETLAALRADVAAATAQANQRRARITAAEAALLPPGS